MSHPNRIRVPPAPPEIKRGPLALKRVDLHGTFEGYACLFNVPDLGDDVIAPGAFRRTLADRGAKGIKLLYQHDPTQPIGFWLSLVEDARGLFARGHLMTDVAKGREVLSLMRAGVLDGLSIGYRSVKSRREPKSGLRRLEQIDLWEISVVTFPMQPDARIAAVKTDLPHPGRERVDLKALALRRAAARLTASTHAP